MSDAEDNAPNPWEDFQGWLTQGRLHPEGAPGQIDGMLRQAVGDEMAEQLKQTQMASMAHQTLLGAQEVELAKARVNLVNAVTVLMAMSALTMVVLIVWLLTRIV